MGFTPLEHGYGLKSLSMGILMGKKSCPSSIRVWAWYYHLNPQTHGRMYTWFAYEIQAFSPSVSAHVVCQPKHHQVSRVCTRSKVTAIFVRHLDQYKIQHVMTNVYIFFVYTSHRNFGDCGVNFLAGKKYLVPKKYRKTSPAKNMHRGN
jgi:hypothetical protein